jgi:ribosomal protein S18 acetylase RimI-like enzyme
MSDTGAEAPVIRPASVAAAGTLAALFDVLNTEYDEPTPGVEALTGHYADLLEAGELQALLAEPSDAASQPAADGFSQFRLKRSHYTGLPDAHIEELYVVPARRGEGIGRALLEATIAAARTAGATHIELTTGEEDRAARALYESAGFTNREGGSQGPRMLYYERELS